MSRTLPRDGVLLCALVAVSAVVRSVVALDRPTPLYYPDEYIYTALARSIASTGLPRIRGAFPHFPALLGPYLMSPAWLIHNIDLAYRVALAWGSLWFSLAALPAYAIARSVGVSGRASLFVAALALLLPDAVFTTGLMTEPYAYPVFLTFVAVAVRALTSPTRARQIAVLGLTAALCLLRVQFVIVPAAYIFAALVNSRLSIKAVLRRQVLVIAGLAAGGAAVAAVGTSRVAGYYTDSGTAAHYSTHGIVKWGVLDLLVLMIAAGWIVLPGAVTALPRFVRGDPSQRAFAALTITLTAGLLAVTVRFGLLEGRVYERYMFYVVPLIVVMFVWAYENLERDRLYAVAAYVAAAAAVVVPAIAGLPDTNDDMSPTLLGLGTIAGSGNAATLGWVLGLALLAIFAGLRVGRPLFAPVLVAAVTVALGAAGTESLLGFGTALGYRLNMSPGIPKLHAPPGSALVTSAVSNQWLLMKTLFWNPNITRVFVVGPGQAPDGFAATSVRLDPERGLVDLRGRRMAGPLAFDSDTVAAVLSSNGDHESSPGVLRHAPSLLIFGWNRVDGYLETTSWLYAVSRGRARVVTLLLDSPNGSKTMSVICDGRNRLYRVGARPTRVPIHVPARSVRSCQMRLVKGLPVTYRSRTVSVRARLAAQGNGDR